MRDNLAYRETVAFAAWAVWWGILAFLVAAALVYVTVKPARAHDAIPTASQPLGWRYGFECCSDFDCREMGDGQVVESTQGYVTPSSEVIPYGDKRIKQSKDEFYHLCTVGGKADGRILCLYVPARQG